jgi:hypothetical protein
MLNVTTEENAEKHATLMRWLRKEIATSTFMGATAGPRLLVNGSVLLLHN